MRLSLNALFALPLSLAFLTSLPPSQTVAQSQGEVSPATNPDVSFRRPLRVVNARTSNKFEQRRSEYRFSINFPEDAVEPLERIVFAQVEGAGYPRYQGSGNYAFDSRDRTELPLSEVNNNRDNRTIVVEFDPPVEPGRDITVALRARNPRSGIYTYQLTAFPVGATEGQYAGVESLTFYDTSDRRRLFR